MRTANLLVKCLEAEGVRYVFGVSGEEVMDILDALRTSSIEFIPTRHEQGAAFMASVVGRLTGKAGVCLATLGPGATNLTTGIADATLDHAPLVAITGQSNLKRTYKESKQYVDIVRHFMPITKWNARVEKGIFIPEMVRKAFKLAQTEKPGACHLEVPSDISKEDVEGAPLPVIPISYSHPDEGSIKLAAQVINQSERPIILAGNGVVRGEASDELRKFIAGTNIPVTHTFMSMGCVPGDSNLCLLSAGLQFHDYVACGFDRADLVITIGYDFNEYEPELWNRDGKKKIVHIDLLPGEVDFHYTPKVEVLGDIKKSLGLLSEIVKKKTDIAPVQTLRKYILEEFKEYATDDGFPLKPQRIMHDLNKVMGRNDILVSDVGAHMIWVARMYQAFEPKTVLISFGYATMGFGIPAAIAAKLINPEKKVVAVCGDGGFMMTSMELETACRINIPFVTVIFNDNGFGLIKWRQINEFGIDFGVSFRNPDFVKYAESFGMKGYRIKKASELVPTLKEALNQNIPTLIDIPVDYTENLKLTEKYGNLICPV